MATTSKSQKNKLSCASKGPGPAYKLPPLVGYDYHDPSKYRNPAFTFKKRAKGIETSIGPGPVYDIQKLTRKGPQKAAAFTITGRPKIKTVHFGPGPGAHRPESCPPMNHSLRPPAYTLKSRQQEKYSRDGPGPNAYFVPSCLGPRIPDKRALGAFTITGLKHQKRSVGGPSPADYSNYHYDTVKKKYPAYSLKSRWPSYDKSFGPGPVYYSMYNVKRNPPKFSFGIRHSECAPPAITELDDE